MCRFIEGLQQLKFTHIALEVDIIDHQSKALVWLSYAWVIFYNQTKHHQELIDWRRRHATVHLAKFKLCLKIVTVSTVSIGVKPAKVTKYSINYNCIWILLGIQELHALFFSLSAVGITLSSTNLQTSVSTCTCRLQWWWLRTTTTTLGTSNVVTSSHFCHNKQ